MYYSEDKYNALIEWLYEQFPSYQMVGDRAVKLGLEAMGEFNEAIGNPYKAFPSIHVAGTNGKGSTSSMLASAISACGFRVGLYTSPHLTDFRERMKVVGPDSFKTISKEEVFDFFERTKPEIERIRPSFFEITTTMAFDYFAREKVDFAIIEVGLGGRLDATNIITPILSVITNISLEHCQYLGYTLPEVAGEKAGIIKPGVPVVVGETLPETKPVFEAKAAKEGSRITFAEEVTEPLLNVSIPEMDLQGDYQQRNIRTLDAAVQEFLKTEWAYVNILSQDGYIEKIEGGVRRAAARTGLRARWETLREAGDGRARIICDTGHNAHAFRWIREQIDKISCDYDNIFFILGIVADKDLNAIAEYLPHDVNYIFTCPSTNRALPVAELANTLSDYSLNGRTAASALDALTAADSLAGEKDLIFIAGSNYLISDILKLDLR